MIGGDGKKWKECCEFLQLVQKPDAKNSLEKTLMLAKTEGRRRAQQRMRWLDGINNLMDISLSKQWGVGDGQGSLVCRHPLGLKELDTTE